MGTHGEAVPDEKVMQATIWPMRSRRLARWPPDTSSASPAHSTIRHVQSIPSRCSAFFCDVYRKQRTGEAMGGHWVLTGQWIDLHP